MYINIGRIVSSMNMFFYCVEESTVLGILIQICTSLVYTFCQKCKMNFFHFYNYLVIHLSIYRWADTHDIVCLWGSENNSWEPVPSFSHVYGFGSSSLAVPFPADPSTLP